MQLLNRKSDNDNSNKKNRSKNYTTVPAPRPQQTIESFGTTTTFVFAYTHHLMLYVLYTHYLPVIPTNFSELIYKVTKIANYENC